MGGVHAGPASATEVTSLAPVEAYASGFLDVRGAAVAPEGTLYVTDREAGTVTRIAPDRQRVLVVAGLARPVGVALDVHNRPVVAEERAGRLVRIGASGAVSPLLTGVRKPRWVALDTYGTAFVSVRRPTRTSDPEPDDDTVEPDTILALTPAGRLTTFADGFRHLQGLVADRDALLVASAGRRQALRAGAGIVRIPIQADGTAGAPVPAGSAGAVKRPVALGVDGLGAVYVTEGHTIAKVHPDGVVSTFADRLAHPQGVALDTDGHLYVADGRSGRVLRFLAPPPPTLEVTSTTSRSSLGLRGRTEPGARVDVLVDDALTAVSTLADATGGFAIELDVPVTAATIRLRVFATGHAGLGLTSAPAEIEVTLDSTPPALAFHAPPAGAHVRQTVRVEAQATDAGGVQDLSLTIARQALPATLAPAPPAPSVSATANWSTTAIADGAHTLGATARDRAGNEVSTSRVVIVDNTPPETEIAGGPGGDVPASTTVTFALAGTDNLTPVAALAYAWRLDAGPWSAFSNAATVSLTSLAEGPHTLAVVARDLAGNEDATPATRAFVVRSGPLITAVTPASGQIGTLVTVSGSGFEAGATQVSVGGAAAVVRAVTATAVTLAVPPGAATGLLVVTTPRGAASTPFAVAATGDFALAAAPAPPASLRAIAGDEGTAAVTVHATGTFSGLVGLAVAGLPPGVRETLTPPSVAAGGLAMVRLAVAGTVPAGVYDVSVTGEAEVDGRRVRRAASLALQVLPPDTTAITGRVLTADAVPQAIPGATVTLGSAFTLTDAAGNFTLLAPPPGPSMLLVDGRTASTALAQYPPVEIQVQVASSGPTRVPFPLYLPRLDTAHPITLPLDSAGFTTATVEATTPLIPGLVVTIPQATRITGLDGNAVSQITITPVPVDRSPMPFPPPVAPPMLFTIQPGGAVPSRPLPITFTNPRHAAPGSRADLYFFDLVVGNWAVWGQGTVDADGARVVPDPGAGLPRFAWHFACGEDCYGLAAEAPPADNQPAPRGGDPVDLFTGRLVVEKTDLVLPGRIPIRIQRTSWSGATHVGPFGIGWTLVPYDARLVAQGDALLLVQADQSRLLFLPDGPGRWVNRSAPYMVAAVLMQRPGDFLFQIRHVDGSVHLYDRIVGFSDVAALSGITDRHGNTVTIVREGTGPGRRGRIARLVEPAGRAFLLAHDASDRIVSVTDPIGRVVRYTYDGLGRLETVTDPAGGATTYAYDDQHRIVAITDPRGITFLTNEYDPATGRVASQVQADGGAWRFAYATLGSLAIETTVTDPRGYSTTHRFDPRGFRLGVTDALGQATSFERDESSGLLRATVDPLGRRTEYARDTHGNVTAITDPAGQVRTIVYEPDFNRVVSTTDPLGNVTRYEHDAGENLTVIVDPLGHRTTVAHDATGQPTAVTDPLGHTTTYAYDAHGNLARVVDPLGHVTTREYDAAGRLLRLVDPRGAATRFVHDPLNRVTAVTDALGGVTRFGYDASGNLATVIDARGGTTTYAHDTMDRVTTRTDPLGASETFAHDVAGNLVGHTDRKGQVTTFDVDALGRRVSATFADGSSSRFTYDAVGRLVLAEDSREGHIVNSYDLLGRLTVQASPLGAIEYDHDPLGRRTRMLAPGELPVEYGWDAASRLTTVVQGPRLVALEHDGAGRRTRLTRPGPIMTEYTWDAASRLTGLVHRGPGRPLGDLTYAYDPAGNRTAVGGSLARTLLPDPVATTAHDAANRVLTFAGAVLAHDANGNVVSDGPTAYTWDERDRLVAMAGSTTAAFAYDALGRRSFKTVDGVSTAFLHDGLNPLQEVSASAPPATLLAGLMLDEFLVRTDQDGTRVLLTDALGSVLAEVSEDGTVVTEHTYAPFGLTSTAGPTSNPFRFTGRELDTAALYHYRARYYHPRLGRFLGEDPIGLAGGGPTLYAYVRNRPTTMTDPMGLWTPDFHEGATYAAARACGMSGTEALALARSNRRADFSIEPLPSRSTLGPWSAAHAMPGSDWGSFLAARVGEAAALGRSPAALAPLGQALHALQDAYAHAIPGIGMGPHVGHLLGLLEDPDDPANPAVAEYASAARAATLGAIRSFMKGRGEKPRC